MLDCVMVDDPGIRKAIAAIGGSRRELARRLKVSENAIRKWQRVPDHWLLEIERVTGVPPHELRPDLYRDYRRKR
jgi:DNA-binding transcriptional regulator YdaS (Cro superfamily)